MARINTWVDSVLEDILGRRAREESPNVEASVTPPVDIYETAEALVLLVEMPGVDEKGVGVSLTDDVLSITGRPGDDALSGTRTWSERTTGLYQRRFRLDARAFDREKIDAVVKNGLLRLTLPKAGETQTRQIPVKGA